MYILCDYDIIISCFIKNLDFLFDPYFLMETKLIKYVKYKNRRRIKFHIDDERTKLLINILVTSS